MAITEQSIDVTRRLASSQLDPARRSTLGQFMTPSPVANFMASMFQHWPSQVELLDPGAGVGSLTEAFAAQFLERAPERAHLNVSAYEIDPVLGEYLAEHLGAIEERGRCADRHISSSVTEADFIAEATLAVSFGARRYTHTILNPPYKKISSDSGHRRMLRLVGIETVNLYAAFLALAVALTIDGGEIVAIVPRSFCNGAYFRPFRAWLLERVAMTHIHVFESRKKAFSDDEVLQENVIVHFVRSAQQGSVTISTSDDSAFFDYAERLVPFTDIVKPLDREQFIHIPTEEANRVGELFACSLAELGFDISTGPVVDFRLRNYCLHQPTENSVPLLYAHHFASGSLQWPREHKKPNAILLSDETRKWLMPRGWYTITKRFSSKEERRRLVAHVVDPGQIEADLIGFENHLNVIHARKQGLPAEIARGLALFLNSTLVDEHFRTFRAFHVLTEAYPALVK